MGFFNSPGKRQDPSPAELGQLSVLAVTNDEATVEPVYSHLRKFNHKATVVHTISDFVDAAEQMSPDIILMSLNLANTNVIRVVAVMQAMGLPVIVFGENEDEDTYMKLLGTQIRHTILPPMNFESFMERVEFIAMEKDLGPSAGVAPGKPDWGKVIVILREKLLKDQSIYFQERPEALTGGVHIIEHNPEGGEMNLMPLGNEDLKPGSEALFDVFIRMPLNHKCILYLKKGSLVSPENLERLSRLDKTRIFKRMAG